MEEICSLHSNQEAETETELEREGGKDGEWQMKRSEERERTQ